MKRITFFFRVFFLYLYTLPSVFKKMWEEVWAPIWEALDFRHLRHPEHPLPFRLSWAFWFKVQPPSLEEILESPRYKTKNGSATLSGPVPLSGRTGLYRGGMDSLSRGREMGLSF